MVAPLPLRKQPPVEPVIPWPIGTAFLSAVILVSSLFNWGTVDYLYYTNVRDMPSGVVYLEPPGGASFPPNIVRIKDPSGGTIARKPPVGGTAWQSGFLFGNSFWPHWIVVVLLPFCLLLRLLERLRWRLPFCYIRWPLCGYGCFHVFSSFMAFGTTGRPGAGLMLAILCYAVLALAYFNEWGRMQAQA